MSNYARVWQGKSHGRQVTIIERPEFDDVTVYVESIDQDGVPIAAWGADGKTISVKSGEERPLWTRFPFQVWAAIVEALAPEAVGDPAREREMTDRLLGMIEREWDAKVEGR